MFWKCNFSKQSFLKGKISGFPAGDWLVEVVSIMGEGQRHFFYCFFPLKISTVLFYERVENPYDVCTTEAVANSAGAGHLHDKQLLEILIGLANSEPICRANKTLSKRALGLGVRHACVCRHSLEFRFICRTNPLIASLSCICVQYPRVFLFWLAVAALIGEWIIC